jgi:hypothetical protein
MSEGFIITGAENIEKASLMALRAALKLEVRGMKRRGRPASVIVRERTGSTTRDKAKLYTEFNAWLEDNYGIEPSPLEPRRSPRRPVTHTATPYDPTTDDGSTFYGEGLDMPSYGS